VRSKEARIAKVDAELEDYTGRTNALLEHMRSVKQQLVQLQVSISFVAKFTSILLLCIPIGTSYWDERNFVDGIFQFTLRQRGFLPIVSST
jgi:uncharacterized membrane protein YhfC